MRVFKVGDRVKQTARPERGVGVVTVIDGNTVLVQFAPDRLCLLFREELELAQD